METHLADWIKALPGAAEAESILRSCVHCGMCNATCPTYRLLGDELDGPRGRIYQIKQVLEGAPAGASTQRHLDRCLTCMNCETTCPSGVRYGRLLDFGRTVIERKVPRTSFDAWRRRFWRHVLTRPALFGAGVAIGRWLRYALPASLRTKLPPLRPAGPVPRRGHARKVLLLNGCVQPALMPAIDAATRRVLDALAIEAIVAPSSGCCGAIDHHLAAADAARQRARRNIDAWWPHLERGAEAIVINASGCGAMVKDYAHLLRHDDAYATRAARVARMACDLAEFLTPFAPSLAARMQHAPGKKTGRIAFHAPCTLQHTQQLAGVTEALLGALGAELVPVGNGHLCCGAAGTYAVLQPGLAARLRANTPEDLRRATPDLILSANIGCLAHLETGADVPVRHWIEWIDAQANTTATVF
jgi:glycolate oxidase iron-sulfur subunit